MRLVLMVLSAGSAVLADETEAETSNVNRDGSVNDPSKVSGARTNWLCGLCSPAVTAV